MWPLRLFYNPPRNPSTGEPHPLSQISVSEGSSWPKLPWWLSLVVAGLIVAVLIIWLILFPEDFGSKSPATISPAKEKSLYRVTYYPPLGKAPLSWTTEEYNQRGSWTGVSFKTPDGRLVVVQPYLVIEEMPAKEKAR